MPLDPNCTGVVHLYHFALSPGQETNVLLKPIGGYAA